MKKLRCFAGFTTIVVSSFIFLSFLFTSCEIGLGSAVDTQSPQLSVTSPKVDSVIRDKFAIKGTWEDDGSIKNLSAVLERTDGFGKPIKLKGVWETDETEKGRETGTGNWFVIIDPEDVDSKHNKLIDGTYQATVSITDNGNHVTTQSTTFTVDNTPPLLILKKPNSTPAAPGEEEKTLSVYGQTLYLEGSIADLTKQTWIQMDFYSDVNCGQESYLYSVETDSIAPTDVNQNNTKFAVYEEIVEEDGSKKLVDNDYSKIYNSDVKIGAVPVYAKLTIYDTAETIPLTAEEMGLKEDSEDAEEIKAAQLTGTPSQKGYVKGNKTQEFFISSDLARDLTKSEKNGGYGFAPIEMYNILNGTEDLKDESRSAGEKQKLTREELITLLASKSKKESVFSINPDNNPYFTISGLKTLSGSPRDFAASDGGYFIKNGSQTLEISVFMGSDSYELDADSGDFYAYLLEFTFDENGHLKYDDKEENRIKLYSKYKDEGTGADKKSLYKIGGKEGHKTTTGAYVFAVPITKKLNTNTEEGSIEYDKLEGAKLVYGHNYLIRVNGKDVEGNPIDNESNKYGFRFSPSGAAPVVNITEPEKSIVYLKKGDALHIQGSVSSEESGLIVSFYKDTDAEPLHTIPLAEPDDNSKSDFEWTIPATTFDQNNSINYSLTIKVAGQESSSSPVVRTVCYDVEGPTVIINKEQPIVEKTVTQAGQEKTLKCINGDFYLEGIFDEDFDVFESATYEVIQKDDSGTEVVKKSGILPKKFDRLTSKVDTTLLTDKKDVIYKIRAEDRAGNETVKELEYFVDQSTDIPVITNKSLKLDADEYDKIKKDGKDFYNMFQRSSNLILYVDDDDGIIETVTIALQKYKTSGAGLETDGEELHQTIEGQNVIQYQLPEKQGIYKATVIAQDIYGAQGIVSFFLKVTGNGPAVTPTPIKEFISTKDQDATYGINFVIQDEGSKPYKIYYTNDTEEVELTELDGAVVSADGNTITYNGQYLHYAQGIKNTEGEEKKAVVFTIRDVNNVATITTVYPKFDNEDPVISFDENGGLPDIKRTGEDNFYFKGNCSDVGSAPDDASEIKEVRIAFADGENKTTPDTNWILAGRSGSSWNYEAEWFSAELKDVFKDSTTNRYKEGKKTVLVKAIDNAGNEKITTAGFTFDRTVPEITEITGDEYTNKDQIILNITVKDTNPEDLELKLFQNGLEKTIQGQTIEPVSEDWNDETGVCTLVKKVTIPLPKIQDTDENGNNSGDPHCVDGAYTVQITAKDYNDRKSVTKTKEIIRDTEKSETDNIAVKTNSTQNKVYNSSGYNYFINNKDQKFKLSGTSHDNIGIKQIDLKIVKVKSDGSEDLNTKIEPPAVTNPIWSFDNLDMSGNAWATGSKGANAYITVTDKAGNKEEILLNLLFDVTAPKTNPKIDDAEKNLEFRIGDAPNDAEDPDVGSKYSNGSYGSSQTMLLRGNFPDNEGGSGINKFYYKTFTNEVTIDENKTINNDNDRIEGDKIFFTSLDDLRDYVIKNKTDIFSPLEENDTENKTKYVEYNMKPADPVTSTTGRFGGNVVNNYALKKGYVQFRTLVETNFKTTIKGFQEGKNYLVIVAEDNVGNAAVDWAELSTPTDTDPDKTTIYPCYSLNVDIKAPKIPQKHKGIVYTNVVKKLESDEPNPDVKVEITGTVSDKPNVAYGSSGIKDIVFTSDQNDETVTLEAEQLTAAATDEDATLKNWTVDIRPLLGNEGTAMISAVVTDNAGYYTSVPVATVIIDLSAPEVSINNPADADRNTDGIQINGSISLSGTAQDNSRGCGLKDEENGSKTIVLYYTTNPTLGAKDEKTILATDIKNNQSDTAATKFVPLKTVANTFSWEFTDIDTKTLDVTDDPTVYFMVSTQDKAGNTGYSKPMAVIVDQDTDRPVISLTNLVLATTPGRTSFLKGSSKLEGTISDDDGNVKNLLYSTDGTSFTEINLQYGSAWSIPGLEDDEKTIYFKVTDAKNNTFTTVVPNENTTELAPGQPKIKDENNTYVTHTHGSLVLKFMVVTKKPEVQNIGYQVLNNNTNEWENRTTIGTLGGIYKKFKISLEAKAVASISSVKAIYNDKTKEFNCADTEYNDKEFHKWNSPEFELVDGKNEIKLIISDDSSEDDPMQAEDKISFSIDNTSPTIRIKDPSATVGVKETMQFDMSEAATAYYAVTRDTVNEAPTEVSIWTEIKDNSNGLTRYVFFDDDLSADDHTDRFALYLTEPTTEKPNRLDITRVEDIEAATNPFDEITTVKFWVKAVDSCGNVGYSNTFVNVDPQGNRPIVTINYPINVLKKDSTTEYEPPTLGGTIRLDGNVTDDIAAKYVWVKIERDNQSFSAADIKFLSEKNYRIGNMLTNELLTSSDIEDLNNGDDVSNYAIRVPVTGTSWNLSINGNLEFNKIKVNENDSTTTECKLIIYATDADSDKNNAGLIHIHRSAPIEQSFKIDSANPYINVSELELVKYEGNTVIARQQYKEGSSVEGIWYLTGTIKDDDSGLKIVKYKFEGNADFIEVISQSGDQAQNINSDSHFFFTKQQHTGEGNENKYDYKFSIPLGNSTAGIVGTDKITITAFEDTDQNLSVTQAFSVIYDNKAPVINTDSENSFVKLSTDIYNANGFYTFGAIASEDTITINNVQVNQSGVERIAFYFTRDLEYSLNELDENVYTSHTGEKDSKTNDLFDIMIYRSGQDAADVTSGNMIINYKGKTDSSALKYSEGLYWRTHAGSGTGNAFTYDGSVDPNIHAGGLVKINGVIYKISAVTDTTINLPSNIDGATSADFALCNVIDNGGEKNGLSISNTHGYGFGYYGTRNTDDGDLITETFNNQGTEWIFDASINSKNLPDGPVTLHIIAFDKAGNYNIDPLTQEAKPLTLEGTVKNNAPRIAGLIFGTDENGNNSIEDGEFLSAYSNKYSKGYDSSGNEMHDVSFPVIPENDITTSLLSIKGLTVLKPEIIGGNGIITYAYNAYDINTDNNKWNKNPKATKTGGNLKKADNNDVLGTTDIVEKGYISLPISDFIGTTEGQDSNTIPDGNTKFVFTFGDTTPGKEKNNPVNNNATMTVYFNVALREKNAAKNWILPFYWKNSNDNSLFGQSRNNGHIELAKDWVTTTSCSGNSSEKDADPKVSGMIKIEGVAQDDTLLREIKVQFGTAMGDLGTNDTTIANYDATNANWTVTALENDGSINATTGWASEVQQASYQDLVDAGLITAGEIPTDKEPASKVPYTSQEYGHVVHWILYLDTAKIDGVAATDVTVTATATDRGTPKWIDSGVDFEANEAAITGKPETGNTPASGAVTKNGAVINVGNLTGFYQMDVVPYVTTIETALSSGLKSSIRDAYSRTALGHYIARMGEKILINGFNLAGGTVTFIKNDTETCSADYDISGITIPADAKSGKISIEVNGVETLNNINDNNACGAYKTETTQITENSLYADKVTYAYNRLPNRTSNNLLTDDLVIDIWQLDSDAAKPMSGELREPSMKINPVTGQVGLAFVSGPADIAMADSTSNLSYNQWQNCYATFNNISFTYDALGFAHATATGLDTNPKIGEKHAGRFSYFYNKWGQSGLDPDGNYSGSNAIRLESIAVPLQASTTDFTHSNTYTEDDLNTFNNGQTVYEKIMAHTLVAKGAVMENDILTETRFNSPSLAATVHGNSTAVYLAYYDSIQNQIRFRYNSELPESKEDKDDFVDNEGYRPGNKLTDEKAYQEAYTSRFSIIAGIDYQQGEDIVVPSTDYKYVNIAGSNKTDDNGNILYPIIYRRAKTDKGKIIIDTNKKTEYKIQNKILTAENLNTLHDSLKGRFTLGQTVRCIVHSTDGKYWWIIQDDGLINMCPKSANNVPPGSYCSIVSSRTFTDEDVNIEYPTDKYIDGEMITTWYERLTAETAEQQDYYAYYNDAPEFFFPYPSATPSQEQIPVYTGNKFKGGYNTGVNAYKYVAIDAIKGDSAAEDKVAAVWYDGTRLNYAYTDNPTNGKDNNIENNNLDENNKGWKGNKVIFSEGGEHCAIKIDPHGGVHIAAYADGSLRYAYLPSVDAEYNEATASVLVDSFTITGERINLDVGLEQVGNTSTYVAVPYITYYNGTARKPTVARLVIPENSNMDYTAQGTGTDDGRDIFTGNWEISLVPTGSNLTSQYYDKMNIGLWKNEGKIVESTNECFTITGQNGKKTSDNNISFNSSGNIYGNGTANPIVGYAVESTSGTYFETAQMK